MKADKSSSSYAPEYNCELMKKLGLNLASYATANL